MTQGQCTKLSNQLTTTDLKPNLVLFRPMCIPQRMHAGPIAKTSPGVEDDPVERRCIWPYIIGSILPPRSMLHPKLLHLEAGFYGRLGAGNKIRRDLESRQIRLNTSVTLVTLIHGLRFAT